MTKSESLSLSDAWIGRPSRVAGPPVDGREGLGAGRVVDDADDRPAVDDQADRHAEERDAVRVVHGAVERVDDPDPAAARGGRLARDGPMLPGLLGEDRVARIGRPDGVEDERLGQVVRLGHDVPGALVVDLLEPLVAVHQDLAGADRDRLRERQLALVGGGRRRLRGGASWRTALDRQVADRGAELGHGLGERDGRAGIDARAQEEGRAAAAPVLGIRQPAGRLTDGRARGS